MATAKKVETKLRRLREQAAELMSAEKYDRAVDIYEKLSRIDETNGEWARRAADCHWHLKNPDQRLKYSLLAARAYSEEGLMLKAIAMCKVALSIDPHHRETQEELARLHSRGPHGQSRGRSEGVPRRAEGAALGRGAAAEGRGAAAEGRGVSGGTGGAQRRNSPRPTTPEEDQKRDERTRARMAAAAALRLARAQQRKEDVAEVQSKREAPEGTTTPQKAPRKSGAGGTHAERILAPDARETSAFGETTKQSVGEKVVARVALRSMLRADSKPLTKEDNPPSSAPPPRAQPLIPSLRVDPPAPRPPRPGLTSLRLSERVPARNLLSLPPAPGNVYSLALGDIPSAELTAFRVPNIKLPPITSDDLLYVPVIPPPEDEPPPDSVNTEDISFGSALSSDRGDVANRDFAEIPLLSDLPADVLRQLITDVAMVELQTNEVLFAEGDPADAMYVVVEGSVTAVTLPHREKPIQLAHLLEGDFFGEIGLMSDQPRGATVTAHEPTRLLRFDRDIVAVLIEQDPNFLATLLQFLKDRLVEDLMMSSPLFTPFNKEERYDLADQFEFLEIEPDSILLERGQHPIGMYVLLTGEASMKGASEAGTLRRLGPGDIFGEQALLENEVSKVEVRTSTKCFALCLPSDAFPEVIMSHPTVLEYLSTLNESSKGELDVAEDFLDHVRFF